MHEQEIVESIKETFSRGNNSRWEIHDFIKALSENQLASDDEKKKMIQNFSRKHGFICTFVDYDKDVVFKQDPSKTKLKSS